MTGHGGGGRLTAELVGHLFLPAFGDAGPSDLGDSAVLDVGGAQLAFSTASSRWSSPAGASATSP